MNANQSYRGLTLAELVVVLFILTVLSAVAVQSLGPIAQKTKAEATRRSLENIRAAIIGDPSIPNSASASYVGEHGILPPLGNDNTLIEPTALERYLLNQIGGMSPLLDGWQNPIVFSILSNPPRIRLASLEPEFFDGETPLLSLDIDADDAFGNVVAVNITRDSTSTLVYTIDLLHSGDSGSVVENKSFINGPQPLTFSGDVATASFVSQHATSGTVQLPIGTWMMQIVGKDSSGKEISSSKYYFNLGARQAYVLNFTLPAQNTNPPVFP